MGFVLMMGEIREMRMILGYVWKILGKDSENGVRGRKRDDVDDAGIQG